MEKFIMWLEKVKFTDIEKYLKESQVVLIPMGSTEQHSKALPLGTDTLIAEKICEALSTKYKWLIVPAVRVGFSSGHQPFLKFAGTISYKRSTVENILADYIKSLLHHGFRKFYIVNAHGGNNKIIKKVTSAILRKNDCKIYLHNWWKINKVVNYAATRLNDPNLGHAGASEASLAIYLFPQLVNKAEFTKEYSGIKTKSGVIDSDQTVATKIHGKNLFNLIIKTATASIKKNNLLL